MKIGINGHQYEITKTAAAVVVLAGALGAGFKFHDSYWPRIGWTTPAVHASDIDNLNLMAADIEQRLADEVHDFRDEWLCRELSKELRDMLREQLELTNRGQADTDLNEDIQLKRQRIGAGNGGLNCANRFPEV